MKKRLLLSAAAAVLIAGTGVASAQGTMSRDTPSAAPQASPSTERGASDAATPMNRGSGSEMNAKEPTQPSRAGDSKQRAQDNNMQPGKKSAQEHMKGDKSKSMSSENDRAKDNKNMKAEGRNGSMNADSKNPDSKSQTTGQAGAGAKLSTEQRTKITTVIREQKVQPVTNVNFSISIGTRVPKTVHFHPLPAEIITVYPAWRGYEFFLVRDEIIVVNPRTLEIVAVLEA